MSDEGNPFLRMKDRLNSVSPSLCLAKWKQVTLHLHSGKTHSCHHPKVHSIPLRGLRDTPSLLHNTPHKKRRRKMMLKGKRPSECKYCWSIEDLPAPHLSDRYIKSADPIWAEPYFDEVIRTHWNENVSPSYVEVSFSRACNFKCSYCSENFSSRWAKEIKEHGFYPTSRVLPGFISRHFKYLDDYYTEETNPYIEAFWKWWPELKRELKVFRITGGEPLLSENTFKVLDELMEAPAPNLELAINSNLGVPRSRVERLANAAARLTAERKIARFTLFTSVDAWGVQAEYIRHGMEFDAFWKNVAHLLEKLPDSQIIFMVTFNALSVTSFKRLLEETLKLRQSNWRQKIGSPVVLDISYLRDPDYQAVNVLPPEEQRRVHQLLEWMNANSARQLGQAWGFQDYELKKMSRLVDWMMVRLSEPELRKRRRDFFRFFSEHDRRRGTRFLSAFPELENFWRMCARTS